MDDKTALDEILFIKKVIEDSKKSVTYNGKDYIVWGILVIVGMLLQYGLHMSHIYFNYIWIWLVLVPLGWGFSFYNSRNKKEKLPKTFAGKIISSVWLATGIGMTMLGFIGPFSGAIKLWFISPVLSVAIGTAYFITGRIVEAKWLSNLAFGWWIGATIMFFYPGIHTLMLMALMMLFFQTLPGIIMYIKYKQEIEVKS